MVTLDYALKQMLAFMAMYGERYSSRVTDMRAGCRYRRALEALRPEDVETRKLLVRLIGLESPHLYTLFV
jgi:hypothetical protein